MALKHQGSAEYEARKLCDQLSQIEIDKGSNLFDLWVDSRLCVEAACYWSELSFVRRVNWVRMARRIAAGALNSKRGEIDWYKE